MTRFKCLSASDLLDLIDGKPIDVYDVVLSRLPEDPVCKESLHTDPVSVVEKDGAQWNSRVLIGDMEIDGFATNAHAHEYAARLRAALAPYMGKTIQGTTDWTRVAGRYAGELLDMTQDRDLRRQMQEEAEEKLTAANARIAQLESLVGQPAEVTDEDVRAAEKAARHAWGVPGNWEREVIKAALTADRQRRPVMPRRPVTAEQWAVGHAVYLRDQSPTLVERYAAAAKALNEAIGADTDPDADLKVGPEFVEAVRRSDPNHPPEPLPSDADKRRWMGHIWEMQQAMGRRSAELKQTKNALAKAQNERDIANAQLESIRRACSITVELPDPETA